MRQCTTLPRPGRRYRVKSTTEAIIGGVTGSIANPETLLLGRLDRDGRLRYVGRTHPIPPARRRELTGLLTPTVQRRTAAVDHPWPTPLPAAWSGQLEQAAPLHYQQIQPALVVEVEVDTAYEHHRWRHGARYVRARPDLPIYDVPLLLP